MKFILLLLAVVVVVFLYDAAKAYKLISVGKKLADRAVPYSRTVPDAPMRILVAGDSSAVGTGVSDPIFSTAGRLGAAYPDAEIVNISKNGLKVRGLSQMLQEKEIGSFDMVSLQIGANDILQFTNIDELESSLIKVLDYAAENGGRVAVLHSGDIGKAILFPPYVGYFYTERAKLVRDVYMKTIEKYSNVTYIDLFNEEFTSDPTADVQKYYASDKLHLSDEGYRLWFEKINEVFQK